MEENLNIAPKSFLTGQRATERLLGDVRAGTVRQAYIFEGLRGIGKFTAARLFAAAVHCTGESKPCFACEHCKMHMAGTHSDMFVVGDGERSLKIDDIRALSDELYIRPALSDKKIFIVRGSDKMNAAAQNALLKSFEEPPEYGVIILLSENSDNLLPTIRSRGVKIVFEPFPPEKIERYIKAVYPSKAHEADFIARYSSGIIGRAIDICESADFFAEREKMFEACAGLVGDRLSILDVSEVFEVRSRKQNADNCSVHFDLFLSFMRDAASLKTTGKILNEDKRALIESFSSKTPLGAVLRVIERTADTRRQLNVSMKYELWIMNLLINCWEDIHGKSNRG